MDTIYNKRLGIRAQELEQATTNYIVNAHSSYIAFILLVIAVYFIFIPIFFSQIAIANALGQVALCNNGISSAVFGQ